MVRGRKNPQHHGLPARLHWVLRLQKRAKSAASLDAGLPNDAAFYIERRQRTPRIDTVERLAMTLGVSPAWLTYGEGQADQLYPTLAAPDIGERLQCLRVQKGLSRAALGRAAHVSGQTIANIETAGMLPKIDTAELLAAALGVSPGWLAFGDAAAETASARNEVVTLP